MERCIGFLFPKFEGNKGRVWRFEENNEDRGYLSIRHPCIVIEIVERTSKAGLCSSLVVLYIQFMRKKICGRSCSTIRSLYTANGIPPLGSYNWFVTMPRGTGGKGFHPIRHCHPTAGYESLIKSKSAERIAKTAETYALQFENDSRDKRYKKKPLEKRHAGTSRTPKRNDCLTVKAPSPFPNVPSPVEQQSSKRIAVPETGI